MKKILKAFFLGIGAGAAISIGGYFFMLCKAYIPNYGQYIGALCFPIGLLIVCYCSFYLYTGKIGFILHAEDKKSSTIDLIVMVIGNVVGAFLCGMILHFAYANDQVMVDTLASLTKAKTADLIGPVWFSAGCWVMLKGIGCGAFVYLAVFCYKTFKHHILKILGIFISIFAFVALGLEHCIANAFYFSFNFDFTNGGIYLNFLYALIGNSLGALALDRIFEFVKWTFKKQQKN